MTAMGVALDRLAQATEVQVRLLEAQERREREREYAELRHASDTRVGHRSELRRLPFIAYARACPELAQAFARKIPDQFWSLDGPVAEISCPCGETPRSGREPIRCACSRHYLYDGECVRVAGGPNAPKAESEPAESDPDDS